MTFSSRADRAVEILVVEPNHDDASRVRGVFVEAGIMNEIHVVSDGDDALEFVNQRGEHESVPRPDIVLLDLELPGRDREGVLATRNERPEFASITVIGMSGAAAETTSVESSGFDAFVQKPLDGDEFIDVVRKTGPYGISIVRT